MTQTTVLMTSMRGTTTTGCPVATTPPPAAGTTLPQAGIMTDIMIQGIVTMKRRSDTMRIGIMAGVMLEI